MRRPRVLIVIGRALPAIGGSQVFYDALSRYLVTHGIEARIAAIDMPRETVAPEQPYEVIYQPTLREAWSLTRWADTVHTMDFNYFWWSLAKLLGRRTVIVYHTAARICPKAMAWNGHEVCSFKTHWRQCLGCLHRERSWVASAMKWISLPVKQRLADRSDRLVNISDYAGRAFGIPQSLTIVHGIDLDEFVPTTKPARDYFLFVGRLVQEKGGDVAVRAMAEYVRRGGRLPLRIVGEGPERPKLERLTAELGLQRIVIFEGSKVGEALSERFQHARAVLLSVLWAETFGRVCLEAMACGAPVVASRIGAFEDTAAKAGLMFPPGDSAALAEHLIRLSNDGALVASLSDRGIAFSKSFSLSTEMEQYLRLYQELTRGWQADSSVN